MSRLDAEYDSAERHDLDRIEADKLGPADRWPWHAYCACGWLHPLGARTRGEARQWHQDHQDEQLGVRP